MTTGARIELESASAVDPVFGEPFVVAFRLKNTGLLPALIADGYASPGFQYLSSITPGGPQLVRGWVQLVDATINPGETLEFSHLSGNLRWCRKGANGFHLCLIGRIPYTDPSGRPGALNFAKSLWPEESLFLQNYEFSM